VDSTGQAITELIFSVALAGALFLGAFALAKLQWKKIQCSFQLFESVHWARENGKTLKPRFGGNLLGSRNEIQVSELPDSFKGEAHCEEATEKLELPKLEKARWH
jgi:hypothetical protein